MSNPALMMAISATLHAVVSAGASAVVIKASSGNTGLAGSPPVLIPTTIAVTQGDQITVVYTASGSFNAPFTPAISDTDGNVYTLLSATPTSTSKRQLIWTATAKSTKSITISAKGAWYFGNHAIAAYATSPATYSAITAAAVTSVTWAMSAASAPPSGSLALIGVRCGGVAYTVSGWTEDASTQASGPAPSVSIAHALNPASAALGSYNFGGSGTTGDYSFIVLSP
jgi:hypothetical protein